MRPQMAILEQGSGVIFRRKRFTNVIRDAFGRFSRTGGKSRDRGMIGSREREQQRKVQGGESSSALSRKRQTSSRRQGSISSRERTAIRRSTSGKVGAEQGIARRRKGPIGAVLQQAQNVTRQPKRAIRQAQPKRIVGQFVRKTGVGAPSSLKGFAISKLSSEQSKSLRNALALSRRLRSKGRRKGRRR